VSNGIVTDYEYDAGGNLVKEIEGESVRRFEYDDFKRLVKVINPDGTYMENIYDAEGMRVQTVENGEYRRFIFDGNNAIAEVGEDWSLKGRNVRDMHCWNWKTKTITHITICTMHMATWPILRTVRERL